MESSEILASAEASIRIFFVAAYSVVCLAVYRRLFPCLSPTSKFLASVMLVAQVLVIAISLVIQPTSNFEEWFWNLNLERNLQSALASTQLALVGVVALLTAWLARAFPKLHRFYLTGIALVFFYLARDEFVLAHEAIRHWQAYYALLGAVVSAATVVVALRSPRQSWKWYVCLLFGLAISATGAIAIEHLRFPEICGSLGFMPDVGRCKLYTAEESLEFLGIWLTLIAVLGLYSQSTPKPNLPLRLMLILFPVFWILSLSPTTLMAFLEFRLLHRPTTVTFESSVKLLAYRIDRDEGKFAVQFFVSTPRVYDYAGLGYSVDLVDPVTGESIAGADEPASRLHHWPINFFVGDNNTYYWMYKQRIEVDIPPGIRSNRKLWVVLTLWRNDNGTAVPQHVGARTNQQLFNKAQVVLGELGFPAEPTNRASVPGYQPENRFNSYAVGMPKRADPLAWATEASVQFESGERLQSFRLEIGTETALIQLFTSARRKIYKGLGFSIRLVDQASGDSVASHDNWAVHLPYNWYYGFDSTPVYRHEMEVMLPPQIPTNRALWVVLTTWREHDEGFVRQKILSSDQRLLDDTQVVLGELVYPAETVAPSSVPVAEYDNGFTLNAVDMPEHAQAGETMSISFTWSTDKDGRADTVQFLHFGHVESGAWWVHDQQPLGPRLPTRLWYSGLADTEIWEVPLPADLAAGRYTVFTGLYRAGDQVRLPATDAEGTSFVDARVPLGVLTIEGA